MLIDWNEVIKHCPNIKGIIHVGAHTGEEKAHYKDIPTKWVEADKELFDNLKVDYKYWFAATNYEGTAILNIMPFRAANSLLKPHLESQRRKDIYVVDKVEVPCNKISSIQEDGYNFLNLDIQGAELNALKGTDLSIIDYVYTEIHEIENYFDCAKFNEIDELLTSNGFELVIKKMTHNGWGDALYIRKTENGVKLKRKF